MKWVLIVPFLNELIGLTDRDVKLLTQSHTAHIWAELGNRNQNQADLCSI